MVKFTVRLSAFPSGTVDFFDLLRRIFNTESTTRLIRLRQMLSVSAMLANLQKSSKVPPGKADRRTCKVHNEKLISATGNIFPYTARLFLLYFHSRGTFIPTIHSPPPLLIFARQDSPGNKKYSRRQRKQNHRDNSEDFEDFDCAAWLFRTV